jgi:hypothetical protein
VGGSRWIGGKSFKTQKKKKKKLGGGWGEIKVAKKTEIRAGKGQRKKVILGWHRDRKEKPISASSIHVGALVGAGSLWPFETLFINGSNSIL